MKIKFKNLIFLIFIIFFCNPQSLFAYQAKEGHISYLTGIQFGANFQESYFNSNEVHPKLGRSQSVAVWLQAIGDISESSSLFIDATFGTHKFVTKTLGEIDSFLLEAVHFDLGYRRRLVSQLWWSASLGSMYAWRVRQDVNSSAADRGESDFNSLYSASLGVQWEKQLFDKPFSFDLRARKYVNSQLDDQMALVFGIGFRFER